VPVDDSGPFRVRIEFDVSRDGWKYGPRCRHKIASQAAPLEPTLTAALPLPAQRDRQGLLGHYAYHENESNVVQDVFTREISVPTWLPCPCAMPSRSF
jgi:hypothetical protein